MFVIAFDLTLADTPANHPKSVSQAYADIGGALAGFGFERVQGSLYVTQQDNLANCSPPLWRSRRSAGFQHRCGTSGHSGLNNGRTSPSS